MGRATDWAQTLLSATHLDQHSIARVARWAMVAADEGHGSRPSPPCDTVGGAGDEGAVIAGQKLLGIGMHWQCGVWQTVTQQASTERSPQLTAELGLSRGSIVRYSSGTPLDASATGREAPSFGRSLSFLTPCLGAMDLPNPVAEHVRELRLLQQPVPDLADMSRTHAQQ
jgi:hypothetical protein